VGPGASTASHAPSHATYAAGTDTLTLTFSPALTVPGVYRLALATSAQGEVTGDIRDTVTTRHPYETASGNLLDTTGATATLASASAPTISGVRTISPTLTRVTFSVPVEGRTVPEQWGLAAGDAGAAVTGVAFGAATTVTEGAEATAARAGATGTLTLLHAAQDTDWRPRVSYSPDAGGVAANERLRDVSDNALASVSGATRPTASDGAPPVPSSARFTSPVEIELSFSEALHGPSVRAATYAVTSPSGAAASLALEQPPHTPGSEAVTLLLARGASEHGMYRVTASGLQDAASPQRNSCTPAACAAVADRVVRTPVLSSLAVGVLDAATNMPKAANAGTAAVGDILRLRLELSGVRPSPTASPDPALLAGLERPTVSFYGLDPISMRDVSASTPGAPAKSVWETEHTVPSTPQREGQPEFRMSVMHALDALALTQADLTGGAEVTVDTAPPSPSDAAADALYTRTEAAGATTGLGAAAPAPDGSRILVVLTASEPLAGAATADATIAGAPATAVASDHASRMLDTALPANTYVWSRLVSATDAEAPIEFSITVRDAVGNTGTITHRDIRGDGNAATGYRLAIDRTPPTVESLEFASQTHLDLEFDGPVTGVPATLALERAVTGTMVTEEVTATVAHTDGRATASLEIPKVARFHPSEATWSLTVPDTVRDLAGHAYATPDDKVPVSTVGAPSITSATTKSTTSTIVRLSAAVSTLGAIQDDLVARWTVNGQAATRLFTGSFLGGGTGVTLFHPPLPDSDHEPVVAYSPAGGDAGRLVDAATRVFYLASETVSVTAMDGATPRATAAFSGPREITVTADVAYTGTPPVMLALPRGEPATVMAAYPSPTTIVITLDGAVPDGLYRIFVALTDAEGNTSNPDFPIQVLRTSNAMPIMSAMTLSHTQVEVSFPLGTSRMGTADLEASRWAVYPTVACPGPTGTPKAPSSVSALVDSKVILTLAGGIRTGASGIPDTGATATVTYTRAEGDSVEFRDPAGRELGSTCRVVSDGAPPVPLAAEAVRGTQGDVVTVSFSEAFGFGSSMPGSAPPASSGQLSLLPGGRAEDAVAPSSIAFAVDNTQAVLSFEPTAVNFVEAGTLIRYNGSLDRAHLATDAGINAQRGTIDVELADRVPPRIASAMTASATTTEVTYDEEIALDGDVKGLWTLKFAGSATEYPVSSAAIKAGSPRVLVLTHADATTPLTYMPDSTATVSYEGDESCNCGVTDRVGNSQADHADVAVADGIAPLIASTRTSSATVTVVTLDEEARAASSDGAALAKHWSVSETVNGSPVAREVTSAAISGSAVTLTHAGLDSTGATPSVTYTASVDSDGDGDIDTDDEATMVTDTADNALVGSTATAADGAPPTIDAEFATATSIRITLSEPIQRTGGGLLSASNWMVSTTATSSNMLRETSPVEYAAGSAEREITLHLTTARAATTAHTITLPTGITDRATAPNDYAGSATLGVGGLSGLTFTARATAADTIELTFSAQVRRVAADPLPELATASWQVHPGSAPGSLSLLIPVTAVSEPAGDKVTLTLSQASDAHRSTSKEPRVIYNRGTPEIESTSGVGLEPNTFAVANDAAPPTLRSARATSTTSVEVTMSEDVEFSGSGLAAFRANQWSVAAPGGAYFNPLAVTHSADTVTLGFATEAAWATAAPPEVNYLERDGIASERVTLLVDEAGQRLAASSVRAADGIPPVIDAATTLSSRRIDVTLSEPVRFDSASSTADQRNAHWTVTAGGTPRAIDTVEIAASGAMPTVTVTVTEAARWTRGDSPTVSYSDAPADGGRVVDVHGNALAGRFGVPTADRFAPEVASARTESLGRTMIEFTGPVALTEGTDAQARGHWSMRGDDPDGGGSEEAPAITVNSVSVDADDPTRVVLGHDALSGPAATPAVSYDPSTSTGGRLVLAGSAASQVEGIADREVSDGIPPSLVGDPALVGWVDPPGFTRPDNPGANYGMQDAVRLTFDEPISLTRSVPVNPPQGDITVASMGTLSSKFRALEPQPASTGVFPHNIPHGSRVLGDETALTTPPRWSPSSPFVHTVHLADNVLTLRLPSDESLHPVALEFIGARPGLAPTHYLYDRAQNPYIPDASRAHERFTLVRDLDPPMFTAHVDSARQVRVVYDEPVKISDTQSIEASDWRVDTTPANAADNPGMPDGNTATYLTPAGIAYFFDEFEEPELWHHGDLGRQSRLTILLEMGQDVDAAADLNVVSLEKDVEDARGNAEARDTNNPSIKTFEYRPGGAAPAGLDTAAPTAVALGTSVERLDGAQGEFAARTGQFAHHAREGDRVRVGVTLDEPVPLAGARAMPTSTGPTVSDTIVPRLGAGGSSEPMEAAAPPAFRVVIPVTVTDQDGTPFAEGTAHEVEYAPSPPAFSNARFESPTRLLIDVSEPLDDTTLTPDTPATGDAALVSGSVHIDGLGTFAVHREADRVVVTTSERALPGTKYTVRVAGTVADADGVAAAATSLSVTYPEAATLPSARFTERPGAHDSTQYLIGIRASEWLDWNALSGPGGQVSVSTVGASPERLAIGGDSSYVHPYIIIPADGPFSPGMYEVTLPADLQTFAGTPVPDTIHVERHSGYTPSGAPTASNVRFFGPQHIQLDLDQQPDTSTLDNIEVPGLGVKSWSRDGLTVTLALEGRADRVAWEGTWTVPAVMANGDAFGGELDFGVAAPDLAGNVSDIGPESDAYARPRVIADTGAPMFTARVVSETRTNVTFAEPVRGVVVATEWCVGGAPSSGISADGVEFAPALSVDDRPTVTAGQTFTISHAPAGGAAPKVEYSPSGLCTPGAPDG